MTFESGFIVFALLVLLLVLGLVAYATFNGGANASRWHKPVGYSVIGTLITLGVFLAWFAFSGGVQ